MFSGLFDFCSIYTGASLEGAVRLNQGVCGLLQFMLNLLYLQHHGTSREQILNVIIALVLYSLVQTALHLIVVNLFLCLEGFHCTMNDNIIIIVPFLLLKRYVTLPSTGQEGCTMQRNARLVIYCDTLLQVLSLLSTPEYNSAPNHIMWHVSMPTMASCRICLTVR